jgi:hypothetical protein
VDPVKVGIFVVAFLLFLGRKLFSKELARRLFVRRSYLISSYFIKISI